MAKASGVLGGGPEAIAAAIAGTASADAAPPRGPAPVHLWDPPFCGAIDMRIARDGTWFYAGTPIVRPALVKLFASVLRRDAEGFVLVTPVEKVGITVEDAPFLAVEMAPLADGATPHGALRLRTNVDDWLTVGPENPLRFEPGPAGSLKPYALVRGDLWALVGRSVFYDLVARGQVRSVEGLDVFGIASGESFFPMMDAAALDEFGTDLALG